MKNLFTTILLLFGTLLYSQTSLTQGDIAFLGFNLDDVDDYAFILLRDVDASTTINFTDCGWVDGTSSFVCNPGDVNGWTWTSGSNLSLGQVVTITCNGPGLAASVGSVSGAVPVMSLIGDQIFAYQGAAGSPTFIAGVHSNEASTDANWSGGTSNNQTSALPDVLTTGTDAIRLHNSGAEVDNWQYNCTVTSGDVTTVRNAINNVNNWSNHNLTPFSPVDPGCTWSITTLPIELISFDVEPIDNDEVQISWRTAAETNNDFFTIEKSKDIRNWETVTIVDGLGTSLSTNSYQVFDEQPYEGLSYYRLMQTDFDGQYDYSFIESISLNDTNDSAVHIYPNPTNSIIILEGNLSVLEDISIFNQIGQNVSSQITVNNLEYNTVSLNFTNLSSGIYFLITKSNSYKIYKR